VTFAAPEATITLRAEVDLAVTLSADFATDEQLAEFAAEKVKHHRSQMVRAIERAVSASHDLDAGWIGEQHWVVLTETEGVVVKLKVVGR
jgi:hypothetical protein